jgi:hypothetical protein
LPAGIFLSAEITLPVESSFPAELLNGDRWSENQVTGCNVKQGRADCRQVIRRH